MGLIDADKIQHFEAKVDVECGDRKEKKNCIIIFADHLKNIPTAYDIDKVIEQLKEMKPEEDCFENVKDYIVALVNYNKIIEIVKRGGM